MIIANGTLRPRLDVRGAGGIDPETGHFKTPAAELWGDPVPCQWSADRYDALARTRENGESYTERSYTVLVDAVPFRADTVRLSDAEGSPMGEFSVKWSEPLAAVGQTRLHL